MSVIKDLAREHAVFEGLIKRLETSAAGDDKTAVRDVRHTLLTLISALDMHEGVEDAVFGDPSYASREDAKRILDQIEIQHLEIDDLRLEFLAALSSSDAVPIQRLRLLVSRMAGRLRTHFKTEEQQLWPHYEKFYDSLDGSIRRRLEESVNDLESDIAANGAAISNHLAAGK